MLPDRMVKDLYRYIWKVSARDQVLLSLLAIALFLIELAPLELQRRIGTMRALSVDIVDEAAERAGVRKFSMIAAELDKPPATVAG